MLYRHLGLRTVLISLSPPRRQQHIPWYSQSSQSSLLSIMASVYLPISLMDLPDELLLQITDHFHVIRSFQPQSEAFKLKNQERTRQCENHIRQKTLYSLCLTSRRLRRISEPVLYSAFVSSTTWRGFEPIKRFHQTISKHPEFAQRLQYVENRLSDYLGNGLYDDMNFFGAVDMVEEYFLKLASIVNHSPNIEHLSVVSLETSDVSFWRHVLGTKLQSTIATHGFPKLQTLCLQIQSGDYGLIDGSGWFRRITDALTTVPTLKTLRANGVVSSGDFSPLPGRYKCLETIEISECILDFDQVVQLTSACENLKHFGCQWAFLNCNALVHPSDLFDGLSPHKDTLESLRLDVREARFQHGPFEMEPLGCLREFTALKSVTICGTTLLATNHSLLDFPDQQLPYRIAELLPPSLESLTLLMHSNHGYDDDFRIDEAFALWDLAEDCEEMLPKLKEVNIRSPHVLAGINLTEQFKEIGVSLNFLRESKCTRYR